MASKRDLMIKKRRVREEKPEEPMAPEKPKKPKKRRRQRSVIWPILFRLLLVAAVLLLGVLIWRNWDRLAPAALIEWADRLVTGGEGGDGYPVDITGSRVSAMEPVGNNVAVLTDTGLSMYNSAGADLCSRAHTYADPLLKTAGDYVLVTELGGTRYLLMTKKDIVSEGQADNTVLSAAVNAEGLVALATESSRSYMSEVLVLDRNGKQQFHWYSSDQRVVDVDISQNGKRLAVLGLSAQNGELSTTVSVFLLAGGNGQAETVWRGTGPLMGALHYYGNGNIAVVGDTATWVYDPGEDKAQIVSYEDAGLLGYAFSERGLALVTRGYGESGGGTVTVVNTAGKVVRTLPFESDFRHVAAADSGFYLLLSDKLHLLDTGGIAKTAAAPADGLQVVELNGRPLILSLTALSRVEWD